MIRTALGSSRKLGGAAKNLIDGSEKRICRLSFKFWTPHVTERRNKQSFTSVEVKSWKYLPRRFAARQKSTTIHLNRGE